MPLLTAFQHGEDFYLLFPLADCNLNACLKEKKDVDETEYFTWMVGQFVGLADAICAIHNGNTSGLAVPGQDLIGYHHDLKPENILVCRKHREGEETFTDEEQKFGRLKISDFGMGRFRDVATGSKTSNIKGTPAYAAPESRLESSQSRPYDIWSYGCILLEIIIWLVYGPQGRRDFVVSKNMTPPGTLSAGSARASATLPSEAFYYKDGDGAKLNPAVRDHMARLGYRKVESKCDIAVKELLRVVTKCLEIGTSERPKAKPLADSMRRIHERLLNT
jgi:serine/threonine protein kinase